jgi:glycosyltransferase involved in cell wall biosynthesis
VRTKIAFLYSELAGYFLACAEELAKQADVLIIHWPVNPEAPFDFKPSERLKLISKSSKNTRELQEIVTNFSPDTVVCSGWMDKDYLRLVQSLPKTTHKVLTLDNHWVGSWRQYLGVFISPFFLKRIFSYAWVPGSKQEMFAKKLGFSDKVLTGFYCANTALFSAEYEVAKAAKQKHFPKRFLFVARYVTHKGIFDLWQAFTELQNEHPNDWELYCLGTGVEWENRIIHPKIKHLGFVQPSEMQVHLEMTGVYVLPSRFEPWGVSVQEMAAAGFPLILSDAIGSNVEFLDGNGEVFSAGSVEDLKSKLLKMMQLTDQELTLLAQKSHALGMKYTPHDWANKIMKINE